MKALPAILGGDRRPLFAGLLLAALGQGAWLILTALAVREIVGVLREGSNTMPTGALIALLVAGLGMAGCRYAEVVLAERLGQNYVADVRERLFLRLSRVSSLWLAKRQAGALALRYVGDATALKGWVGLGLARGISASVMLPSAFLVLALLDLRLALTAAVPVALVLLLLFLVQPTLEDAHARLRKRRARLAAAMAERVQQAPALRRSGRMDQERRSLRALSADIQAAARNRASWAAMVRAAPDAASGIAAAACLWFCLQAGVDVAEAVAALTTLALIVRPLRQLAEVGDRRSAWEVACRRLESLWTLPTLPGASAPRLPPDPDQPVLSMVGLQRSSGDRVSLTLMPGTVHRLQLDSADAGRQLLLACAGLAPHDLDRLAVLGREPTRLPAGTVLYLGWSAPTLSGSLRRELTLGIGRKPMDPELHAALEAAGLRPVLNRLGGLDGRISEGRRNLVTTEAARLLLARGLLAQPRLFLLDPDELGWSEPQLQLLLEHSRRIGAAALLVSAPQDCYVDSGMDPSRSRLKECCA